MAPVRLILKIKFTPSTNIHFQNHKSTLMISAEGGFDANLLAEPLGAPLLAALAVAVEELFRRCPEGRVARLGFVGANGCVHRERSYGLV